jgi:hypothetical protein
VAKEDREHTMILFKPEHKPLILSGEKRNNNSFLLK